MPKPETTREPVELLAEEFLERRRRGERVSAKDYAAAHPELADEILDLFPTMLALEKLGDDTPAESSVPPTEFEHPAKLGDLKLLREVGRGGMGIVYEAEQESLGRRVAVKILPERALFDTKRLERFRREARTAAALQHPNIVPIYGVGEQDGLHYLVMQLIEGAGLDVLAKLVGEQAGVSSASFDAVSGSLGSDSSLSGDGFVEGLARALVAGDFDATLSGSTTLSGLAGPLPKPNSKPSPSAKTAAGLDAATIAFSDSHVREALGEASLVINAGSGDSSTLFAEGAEAAIGPDYFSGVAKIGIQTAEALAYAHAGGTMHRDIKPANLLLDRRGNVWITDFGLAKAIDPLAGNDGVSRTGEMVGTLRYMAPEQLRGPSSGGGPDPRSDLYSLGLTLYELVTWRPAFAAEAPSELIRKITAEAPADPRRLNPKTPRDLETIILKAIARDPDDRYQTGDDLAADLRRYVEAIPITAVREGAGKRATRWLKRNPLVAGLMAAVVLLGGTTVAAMSGYFGGDASTAETPTADAPINDAPINDAAGEAFAAGIVPPPIEPPPLPPPLPPEERFRPGDGPFGGPFRRPGERGLGDGGPGEEGFEPGFPRRPQRDNFRREDGPPGERRGPRPPKPKDFDFGNRPPRGEGRRPFAPREDPRGLGPAGGGPIDEGPDSVGPGGRDRPRGNKPPR